MPGIFKKVFMPDTMIGGKSAVFYHEMSPLEKFELLDSAADLSGARDQAIPARYRASGKPVLVHILANGLDRPPERLLAAVAKLPPEQLCRILEVGEHAGVRYVVTDPIPGVPHLRQWVESLALAPLSVASPGLAPRAQTIKESAQEPAARGEPGEFTRLFGVPPAAPAAQPPGVTSAEPPANTEPGEFTRLFQPPPAAPESQLPQAEPGEFTRLFQQPAEKPALPLFSPGTPLARSQPEAAPERPEIGEFTRMFAAPVAAPTPQPPSIPPAPSAPTAPPQGPGVPEPPQAGEFTRMFAAPIAVPTPQSLPLPATTHQPPAPDPSQNPGIFESTAAAAIAPVAVSASAPRNPAKPMAQAEIPAKQISYVPMIVILAALFGLAVAIVIFFATRR